LNVEDVFDVCEVCEVFEVGFSNCKKYSKVEQGVKVFSERFYIDVILSFLMIRDNINIYRKILNKQKGLKRFYTFQTFLRVENLQPLKPFNCLKPHKPLKLLQPLKPSFLYLLKQMIHYPICD